MKLKKLFSIFSSFFKIGAFTFGGGYAMIPLIQKEAVEKKKWVSDEDILDIIAIAESTPGPIAINSATFVGYRAAGVLGSAAATLGVVLPSFIIILIISNVLEAFNEIQAVQYAFFGIRAGVLALVVKALINMYKKSKKNWIFFVLAIFSFVAVGIFDVSVLPVLIICAAFSLIVSLICGRRAEK